MPPKKSEQTDLPAEAFEPDMDYDENVLDRYDDAYVREQDDWVGKLEKGKKPTKEEAK